MILAILLLFADVRTEAAVRDDVDCIELNHFYDEQGRLVFDQIIFYDWSRRNARHDVVAWRLIKDRTQLPVQDFDGGCWNVVWNDGEVLRHVRASSMQETFLQYDPELAQREILPKERRRELSKVKVCE